MSKIDLHMHSLYSDDGEFSVKDLLEQCLAAQIVCLAITDHNTVRGVAEALALAPAMGLRVIAGIELDCRFAGRDFHLLGYGFDHKHPGFAEIEESILRDERAAAVRKITLIEAAIGIPLYADAIIDAAPGGVVTGELIAALLLKREDAAQHQALLPYLPGGSRADNPYVNFYWDYFSQGKAAYVPINYIFMEAAVCLIHSAGGSAVLAHPGQNLQGEFRLLSTILQTGIDGLEAYSSYHSKEEAAYFAAFARKHRLFSTCGSDYHGKTKPAVFLAGHGAREDFYPAILIQA